MPREPIPTHAFAIVVARRGDRFLMVQERKHGQTWSLPMGRVEPVETFAEAAIRETLEEAGIEVELDGILRIEHTPLPGRSRMRVVFVAHAKGDRPPKQVPDGDSLGAAWLTLDEIDRLPLRGIDVVLLLRWVAAGARVYPLELLAVEGAAYPQTKAQ